MATLRKKIEVETRMRQLLADSGLPEPDGVEYGHGCVRLFFNEPKLMLVIDIDPAAELGDEHSPGGGNEETFAPDPDEAVGPPAADRPAPPPADRPARTPADHGTRLPADHATRPPDEQAGGPDDHPPDDQRAYGGRPPGTGIGDERDFGYLGWLYELEMRTSGRASN